MKNLALLFSLTLSFSLLAQTPSSIEAVEYDPGANRWYVSNNSNTMLYTDDAGGTWDYFGNANATHGMEVVGDHLFAINSNLLMCYELGSGLIVSSLNIPGASFPNGMGSHENTLVMSDFATGRITKVDVSDPFNMQSSVLVSSTGTTPNGVVIDSDGSRAVIVNWGGNADILGVDIETGEVTVLVDGTGLGNCDGIDIDSEGNYYISSWSPPWITKYSADLSTSEIVVSSGLSAPADISYAIGIDTLGVANSGNNQVTFHSFADNTENISETIEGNPMVQLCGNSLVFNLSEGGNYELRAYSINGKLIGYEELSLLSGKTTVDLERLPAGFSENGIINVSVEGQPNNTHTIKKFN